MAFESQYLGLQRGYDLGFEGFTLPASCLAAPRDASRMIRIWTHLSQNYEKNQRQADIVWSIVIGADRNMGWGAARLQVRNGHMLTWAFIWLPDPQAFPCPFPKKCDAKRQVWAKTRWTMINTFSMHTWCAASQAKDYVFGVIYLIEICIKICGLKCSFFKDRLAKACWSTQLPWGGRPKKAVRSIRSGRSGVFRAI